jgi:hypothetical protein
VCIRREQQLASLDGAEFCDLHVSCARLQGARALQRRSLMRSLDHEEDRDCLVAPRLRATAAVAERPLTAFDRVTGSAVTRHRDGAAVVGPDLAVLPLVEAHVVA